MVDEVKIRRILCEMLPPPRFMLPRASLAHTRHYMPWDKDWSSKREASRTLVFDTFVAVSKDDPVLVCWPDGELDGEHAGILRSLLGNTSYLGRSESWCIMELFEGRDVSIQGSPSGERVYNAFPVDQQVPGGDYEVVSVLSPSTDLDTSRPLGESHPLLIRTTTLRQDLNRIDPPGSRWVEYARPVDCFMPSVEAAVPEFDEGPVKMARYLLDGKVLPRVLDALTVGSVARVAAMSVYGGPEDRISKVLSGKTVEGEAMKGHRHAFYLPSDEDGDGRLDHLTVYASLGFTGDERRALAGLERLYGYGLSGELRLLLVGMHGEPDEYLGGGLFGPSATWISATPYILTRHPKLKDSGRWRTTPLPGGLEVKTPEGLGVYPTGEHLLLDYGILPDLSVMQQDGPLAQLLLSCERRGLPEVAWVEPVPEYRRLGRSYRWIEFKRHRRGVSSPVAGRGFGFKLVFREPVVGPLALGHGCHYGLGLFRADDA